MKQLLIWSAVAISLGLGAISAKGVTAPSPARPAAKPKPPQQGYRCPEPSAADSKSPPVGAAVVQRLKLTRLSRPTPTSAVVRVDATVAAPRGAELLYTYSTTGGQVGGDGPRVTWTIEEAGTWTISLEVNNITSSCTTYTSATYTIPAPRRKRTR